jgi:hypothetical protein
VKLNFYEKIDMKILVELIPVTTCIGNNPDLSGGSDEGAIEAALSL